MTSCVFQFQINAAGKSFDRPEEKVCVLCVFNIVVIPQKINCEINSPSHTTRASKIHIRACGVRIHDDGR